MKLDIKDGYWRMLVPEEEAFNYCYVLPQENDTDPVQLVVPTSLQMGWKFSLPYFSSGAETGRDIAQQNQSRPQAPHPFEHLTMAGISDIEKLHNEARAEHKRLTQLLQDPANWTTDELPDMLEKLNALLESFVDDFIQAVQSTNPAVLLHYSRALLHGIHSVFPAAPDPIGDPDDEPISLKKLTEGDGVWAFRKEILGWIFDGINRTIELPPGKLSKIKVSTKEAMHRQGLPAKALESLVGKLQHACLGIPNGKGLLGPLYKLLPSDHSPLAKRRFIPIPKGSDAYNALQDLLTIMKVVANRPTNVAQLVPGWPHFAGFCDACKFGAGGVWLSGKDEIHPTVWRFRWPPSIVDLFNRKKLTVNDLEMAGLLLQYLVLEQVTESLKHKHAAAWCDNTSTVSWARRLSSSKSLVGQRLVRALSIRHMVTHSSPLAPWSIPGANNNMADLASRSFRKGGKGNYDLTDAEFLTKFNAVFPLSQDASWHMHTLNTKISSLVCAELRREQQPMGSWLRLTTRGKSSGLTGQHLSPSLASLTPSSLDSHSQNSLPLSKPLPIGYEMDTQDEKIRLALSEFNKRWQPSPRPSNWTLNPAPRTKSKATHSIGPLSNNK